LSIAAPLYRVLRRPIESALPAVIGVMNRALRRPARGDSHLKRRDDELAAHVTVHRPADDPAAEEILHRGQI
jgi:hypothetical protein